MSNPGKSNLIGKRPRIKQYAALALTLWTLVLGLIFYWDLMRGEAAVREMAVAQARAHYNKDVAFRLWGTSHGRIYVQVTDKTRPDPNMAHIPERDLETPAGNHLTLINPAAIIRELNRDFGALYGVAGRITGLNPLREENAPDSWERTALEAFRTGEQEVMEFTRIDDEPYLRLMQPLIANPGCLLCHARQGMQVGEVGGAVGVALPLKGLLAGERKRLLGDGASLAGIWLLGMLILLFVFRHLGEVQRKRAQILAALVTSEQRKSAVLESSLDSIITMDHQGRILEFNPAAEQTFGYRRDQVLGRDLAEVLVPPSLRDLHRHGLQRYLEKGRGTIMGTRVETTAMRADGEEFPAELTVTRVEHEGDPVFTAYLRDLTEARRLEERLFFQSTHDDLTGLLNRAQFEIRLARALEEIGLNGEQHAMFYIDLDQFKVVNDISGHEAGDALLCEVGHLLHVYAGVGDTLARLGGDEFGIILEHCSLERAETVARQILDGMQGLRFEWEGKSLNVTTSIGIVPMHSRGQSVKDVLSAADTACYMAKEQGRNRLHLFHPDDVDLARRQGEMRWVSRIHDAFAEERFFLYQQRLEPLNGRTESLHYEILIRMRDRKGEFIAPDVFLSAAERYSLIQTIDRWVVRTVFLWLRSNPRHLQQLMLCSINLSGHSLTDDDFLAFLLQELSQHDLPADRICFEVTETAAVSNLAKASRFIDALRQRGCRFALDDFGSGMSSFAYLKNLPVDFLKIDGAFVRDIMEDEIDFAMVRSINDIGHVMGKKTIAEFVENEEIQERLRSLGVDYAQGYGVARPAPLEILSDDRRQWLGEAG